MPEEGALSQEVAVADTLQETGHPCGADDEEVARSPQSLPAWADERSRWTMILESNANC